MKNKKKYGLGRFLFDFVFGVLTGGLWWLYLGLKFVVTGSR